jgi:hypothetical protein
VFFQSPSDRERYGAGAFVISEVEKHTGGIRLREMPGVTWEPEAFVTTPEESPPAPAEAILMPDVVSVIENLKERLPEPSIASGEEGYRETSFYRLPVRGNCWCGKVLRCTLDGWECEDRHKK